MLAGDSESGFGGGGICSAGLVHQHMHSGSCEFRYRCWSLFVRQCHQRDVDVVLRDHLIEVSEKRDRLIARVQTWVEVRVIVRRRQSLRYRGVRVVEGDDVQAIAEQLQAFHPAGGVIVVETGDANTQLSHKPDLRYVQSKTAPIIPLSPPAKRCNTGSISSGRKRCVTSLPKSILPRPACSRR